ncbi:MAG: ATP synthase subunit I [Candidatus Omnitrophica bacterium]|nr:ATP synthase subunit I [Candidatus Omnitrophota bacterium]
MIRDKIRFISRLAFSALVVILSAFGIMIVFRGFNIRRLFLGIVFGTIVSVINFWLLSRDFYQTRYGEPGQVERWLFIRFFLRYGIIGAALITCLINPRFHIIGFVIGFVAFQLAVFWSMFHWRK